MHPSVEPLNQNISANYGIILKTLDDLDDDAAMRRFTDNTNCANWLLGHLVTSRYVLAGLVGATVDPSSWAELYGRGVVFSPENNYRKLSEIKEGWVEASRVLSGSLGEITDEILSGVCPYPFPVEDKTILGGVAFLTLHECYHVGQVGMLRKILNVNRLFD